MIRALLAFSCLALIALSVTVAVGSGATKRWYWTSTQAEATVKAKVKIPFCRAYPASKQCPGGKLIPGSPNGPLPIEDAICSGVGNPVAGRYRVFTCRFTALNDLMEGDLSITVIGKAAFRWKLS